MIELLFGDCFSQQPPFLSRARTQKRLLAIQFVLAIDHHRHHLIIIIMNNHQEKGNERR